MTKVRIQLGSVFKTADGVEHGPGSEIDLDDAVAQSLIAGGSAFAIGGTVPVIDSPIPTVYAVDESTVRKGKMR